MPEKNINKLNENIESNESSNEVSEAFDKVDSGHDVADLMEGIDMGGEISEKASEKKEGKGEAKAGGKKDEKTQKKKELKATPARPLPSNNVMQRKVVASMKKEEAELIGGLGKLEKNPYQYAERVKKIRALRQKISDFLDSAADYIKEMYLKLFGKKHGVKREEESNNTKLPENKKSSKKLEEKTS